MWRTNPGIIGLFLPFQEAVLKLDQFTLIQGVPLKTESTIIGHNFLKIKCLKIRVIKYVNSKSFSPKVKMKKKSRGHWSFFAISRGGFEA